MINGTCVLVIGHTWTPVKPRLEVLGTCSLPQFLRCAAAAPGAVHVHLQRAVDGVFVLYVIRQHGSREAVILTRPRGSP